MAIVATTKTMKATGTRPIVDDDDLGDVAVDQPARHVAQDEGEALQGDEHRQRGGDRGELEELDQRPVDQSDADGDERPSARGRRSSPRPARPSLMKNEPTTTSSPDSGPTDRSMPPSSTAIVWPMAMNPSAVHSSITDVVLNAER